MIRFVDLLVYALILIVLIIFGAGVTALFSIIMKKYQDWKFKKTIPKTERR